MITENLVQIPSEEIRDLLPIIIENEIPLRRKKSDGSFSFIPAKDFDAYLKSKHVEFYIDPESLQKARHDHKKRTRIEEEKVQVKDRQPEEVEVPKTDKVFEQQLEMAREMDLGERIQTLMNNNYKLKSHSETIEHFDEIAMALAGEVFSSSLMMNKATFEDNLTASQPLDGMKHLVEQTYSLIEHLLLMLSRGKASFRDLARLNSIDTGSTTLDHMNRMLIRMVAFLFFYNSYFQKYSTEVQKFRAYFRQRFLPYYDQIVKGSQNTTLEVVFRGGIGPLKDRKSFIEYSMSGLMHDIGKLPEIYYHDGGEGYNVRKASRHVFDGYNMLLQSKQFSWGTVGACLLHHDYYNAPYGYRQLDTFKQKFPERRTQDRSGTSITYLMSHSINDVGYGAAIGYFPSKVLELIDVFDSMTDERKKYRRSAFTPEEAIQAMRNDFLDGSYPGIDPILYNIFIDFLSVSGVISGGSGISRESLKI